MHVIVVRNRKLYVYSRLLAREQSLYITIQWSSQNNVCIRIQRQCIWLQVCSVATGQAQTLFRELNYHGFGDHIIVWHSALLWPPQRADLTPCDFFLSGHLKVNVFSTPVPDLLMLKSRILAEIGKIWNEILQKVYENLLVCSHICIGNYGHHLPNFILK